jgi:hypothetical protein
MTHIGYPEESVKFFERNGGIEGIYHAGMDIAEVIYSDKQIYSLSPSAIVAFGLIATAYEIFLEIFCLAANGFGRGAQARLRTMYEHVAIAAWIAKDPEQAERFIKFQVVEQRNELLHAKELFSQPGNEGFLLRINERLAKLDSQLGPMKDKFGKRFAGSWHEGMATIAAQLGWEHHFFYDYLIPNRHVHASPLSLERRVSQEERTYFEGAPDHDSADEAVRGGLTVLALSFAVAKDIGLPITDSQMKHFSGLLLQHYRGRPNKTIL